MAIPQRKREHAIEALQRFFQAPGNDGIQQDFAVGTRLEPISCGFKLGPQLAKVVDLAVVAQYIARIGRNHRLMAGRRKVNDRQSPVAEADIAVNQWPSPSGPRCAMASVMPCSTAGSTAAPSRWIKPATPHSYPIVRAFKCFIVSEDGPGALTVWTASSAAAGENAVPTRESAAECPNRRHHITIVILRHAVVQGDCHCAIVAIPRGGKILRAIAVLFPVVAQHVHRVGARPRGDALLLQSLHHVVARHGRMRRIHPRHERLPTMSRAGRLRRQAQPLQITQLFSIELRPAGTLVDETVQLGELDLAHSPWRSVIR